MAWIGAGAASSGRPRGARAARTIRSTARGRPCAPARVSSPTSGRTGSRRCSPSMPASGVRSHGRSTGGWSRPTGTPIAAGDAHRWSGRSTRSAKRPSRRPRSSPWAGRSRIGPLEVLAHFERPGTPNKPTETINDRLEHLRDSAPGSTSPTNHITRPPPETSGHRPRPHPNPEEPVWIQQKIMERASRRCRIAQRRSEPPLEAMISLYQSKDFLRYRASVPVPSSSRST